ncbi:MAG: YggS family pyridoxal phosphate-dependent enzyme [Pseudomonadota bacterium]
MNPIRENLSTITSAIRTAALSCGRNPDDVTLVGVSKKQSVAAVIEGIRAGVSILGENYIQEAVEKIEAVSDLDVSWHFIGHLQSNKAKLAVRYFDLIHTVDSLKLAKAIDRQARAVGKVQPILLQVNISNEQTKSGTDPQEAVALARGMAGMENIALKGLMCMPPFFDDPDRARPFFRALADIRKAIVREAIPGVSMDHLSMGMSGDFQVAIQEGATLVRIGTALFGERA